MQNSIAEEQETCDLLTGHDSSAGQNTRPSPDEAMLTHDAQLTHTFTYDVPWGSLVLTTEGNPPSWLLQTTKALVGLLWLPPDWDSYGALPIEPGHVVGALELLTEIMQDDTSTPTVVPTCRGGVQLEWHTRGIDLEIEVLSRHRFHASFEDSTIGNQWERELTSDLTPLVNCIAALSRDV